MNIQLCLFLALLSASSAFAIDQPDAPFDGPGFASIIENKAVYFDSSVRLQQRLSTGSLTSAELVKDFLQRIDTLNNRGPELNAVIETNPDALQIATQLDLERSSGKHRGPLHGIPVLLKDNIDTADQMQTTAGSLALVGQPAQYDAFVVQRLREAGAIIIGKANLSEWANFRGRGIPNGWSGRGGQTRNPYDLSADTRGSSSGSAVAVAAGLSPLAVGTETNGSIIQPASANGVVGLRPTLGLLSRAGVIPISSRQDTPGPMTRTVTDAAIMLTAMSGTDARDKATYQVPGNPVDYLGYLRKSALQGKRLGYPVKAPDGRLMDDDPAFVKIKRDLWAAGAILMPVDVPTVHRYTEWQMLMYDFKRELAAYLQTRNGLSVRTLEDVIAFNVKNPARQGYNQQTLIDASGEPANQAAYFAEAAELRDSHRQLIDGLLQRNSLDALIDWSGNAFGSAGAIAGYPGINLPVGLDDHGLPRGLYFLSTAWEEAKLLSFAYALEQALVTASESPDRANVHQ
ncbi:amidase family protein [Pseudomonas congelans]|uniref:amidase family protein n=1 Tax=Pseudomonas congelans TaxID=200452 RepID=UPI0004E2A4C6|nr:amidase family protein [Pseudomonas congelans]KFE47265.1 amidase [Pseudomonas congelans]